MINLWLIRAGKHGEREQICLDNGVVLLGWDDMPDLAKYGSREEMSKEYPEYFPAKSSNSIGVNVGQLWRFAKEIKKGDLVAMPSKFQPIVHFGKVKSEYNYGYRSDVLRDMPHAIQVEWLKAIPRSELDQDLLYSFGSLLTVSQVSRNKAVDRVHALVNGNEQRHRDIKDENIKIQEDIIVESTLDIAEHAQDENHSTPRNKIQRPRTYPIGRTDTESPRLCDDRISTGTGWWHRHTGWQRATRFQ